MQQNTPVTLRGHTITLELLNERHRHALMLAANNPIIWQYSPTQLSSFDSWFEKALSNSHEQICFAIKTNSDDKLIGSTRFYSVSFKHRHATIGYTWYIPELWGSTVNPECKYLMLSLAFDEFGMQRIDFRIDSQNKRSIAAVKKLGAVHEGTMRKHIIRDDNYIRDTVIMSIIDSEWPAVKANLKHRIS